MAAIPRPILLAERVPDRRPLGIGMRRDFCDRVVLAPDARFKIVLERQSGRTRGDDATHEKYLELNGVTFEEWKQNVRAGDRFHKVDMSETAIVVDPFDAPSQDADHPFVVSVVAIVRVRSATRVVELEAERGAPSMSSEIEAIVRGVAEEQPPDSAAELTTLVRQELTKPARLWISGLEVRWAHVVVEPDSQWSAGAEALEQAQLELDLEERQLTAEEQLFERRRKLAEKNHSMEADSGQRARDLDKHHRDHLAAVQDEEWKRQKAAADTINQDIAAHPNNVIGYLLSMDDTQPVREAIKLIEDRERVKWERFKEIGKLEMFKNDAWLRQRAVERLWGEESGDGDMSDEP